MGGEVAWWSRSTTEAGRASGRADTARERLMAGRRWQHGSTGSPRRPKFSVEAIAQTAGPQQRALYRTARAAPGYRFYSLELLRREVIETATIAVASHAGAAGVDRQECSAYTRTRAVPRSRATGAAPARRSHLPAAGQPVSEPVGLAGQRAVRAAPGAEVIRRRLRDPVPAGAGGS